MPLVATLFLAMSTARFLTCQRLQKLGMSRDLELDMSRGPNFFIYIYNVQPIFDMDRELPKIARMPINTGSCNFAPIKCTDISLILTPISTDLISGSHCDHNTNDQVFIGIFCDHKWLKLG